MDFRAIGMGLAFALMWSSAFATARIIVADAPPLHALVLRFAISGVIAIVLARALGQNWNLTRAQWRATVVFGVCQNGLYLGLNFIAMRDIEASLAAIIASTMPLLVAMLGWAFFGEKVRPLGLAGLVAGILGVTLIMGARIEAGVDLVGVGLCAIAALALALATLSMRSASSGGNLLMVVGLQMLVGSAVLAVAAFALEDWYLRPSDFAFGGVRLSDLRAGFVCDDDLVRAGGSHRGGACLDLSFPEPVLSGFLSPGCCCVRKFICWISWGLPSSWRGFWRCNFRKGRH